MTLKIGVIVDGHSDFAALNSRFKGTFRVLKTDGPRGHCVEPEQIVSKSRKQIKLLKALGCEKVITVLDYECRNVSIERFISELTAKFQDEYGEHVLVCAPNRMIENWYLADIVYLSRQKKYLKRVNKQKNYEGLDGKEEIKKLMVKKYKFNEIRHGSELFQILRFEEAKNNSASFSRFLNLIKE